MRKYEHAFSHMYFLSVTGYKNLYTSVFPVICGSYLRIEISVILSTGNKLPPPLFFSFLWNHFVDVILRLH